MTAKEYLSRYQAINREVDALCEECVRLRSLAERVGCGQLSDMPKGKNSNPSAYFTRVIEQLIEKENEINAKIDEMLIVRDEISSTIDSVSDATLRTLLRFRYICGMTWEEIAVKMYYTYQWVCELHGRALRCITLDSN